MTEKSTAFLRHFIVLTNDPTNGIQLKPFATGADAEAYAVEWLKKLRESYPNINFEQSWQDIYTDLCEESFFSEELEVHTLYVPLWGHNGTLTYGACQTEPHSEGFNSGVDHLKGQLRTAIADYIRSEGCSCCRGKSHDDDQNRLAELLDVPQYEDGSGYDFYQFCTPKEPTPHA